MNNRRLVVFELWLRIRMQYIGIAEVAELAELPEAPVD